MPCTNRRVKHLYTVPNKSEISASVMAVTTGKVGMSYPATWQCAVSEQSCPPPFLIELAAARPDELLYIHIAQCKDCGARFAAMLARNESGEANTGPNEGDTTRAQAR